MGKAIIYSENPRAAEVFSEILQTESFPEISLQDKIAFCGVDSEATLHLINAGENFDVAVRLAEKLTGVSSAAVMLLCDPENYESGAASLRQSGVIVVSKPLSRQLFVQSVQDSIALHGRIRRMGDQLEEVRRIARAKLLLVEKQHMTEQQAHKYIEKEAMNRRITRLQLADELILASAQ